MKQKLVILLGIFYSLWSSLLSGKTDRWIEFSPASEPVVKSKFSENLTARSWLVLDLESGTLLAGENFYTALPPASLTKIVTALVILDHFSLDQVLTVDKEYLVGKTMGLVAGEKIKAIDLFTGLLVHSANDAAWVFANSYPEGEKAFIEEMNHYARARGLTRTHFVNFDGEEDDNHYSTAYDLGQLARIMLEEPLVRELIQIRKKTVSGLNGRLSHELETTNQLLDLIPEARGLKTGWTQQAGECFVGYFEIDVPSDSRSRDLITVLMGSGDRFNETLKILNWVKSSVVWEDHSATHSIEIAGTKAEKS